MSTGTRFWAVFGLFVAVALSCLPLSLHVQLPGSLDASFNPSIRIDGAATIITPQPDGKLIVGGSFSRIATTNVSALARLNIDGSVDNSFTPPNNPGTLTYAAVGADNKVVALYRQPGNTPQTYTLLRLNTDGSQDAGFTPASFPGIPDSGDLYDFVLAVQPDGKVLVGGPFSTDPSSTATTTMVIRYNIDGSRDTGFQLPSTVRPLVINTLLPLADGQLLVGGLTNVLDSSGDEYDAHALVRLNADGSLDSSYPAGSIGIPEPYALTAQPDGKVLYLQSSNDPYGILGGVPRRLNADGSPDTSFAPSFATGATFDSLVLQPDGKIIVGGYVAIDTSGSFIAGQTSGVVRLNADGTTDTTFNPVTPLVDNTIAALGVQANGQIIVGGAFASFAGLTRGSLARLNADGSADATFASDLTNAGIAYGVVVEAGGQPVVSDTGTLVDGALASSVFSLNTDGSLSTVFAANLTTGQYYIVHGGEYSSDDPPVAVQADGKVLVSGTSQVTANSYDPLLQRFDVDGSLDASFQFPVSLDYSVIEALAPQPDGQLYVAGATYSFGEDVFTYPLNRLNADGSLDLAFTPAADPGATGYTDSVIMALAVQSDGKPLVAGDLAYINGQPQPAVLRFNTDGTVDTGFNAGTFTTTDTEYGITNALALQADGKLLVGGGFVGIGGVTCNNLARLNADGSVDTTFNTGGTGANDYVRSVVIQPNGQIILAGGFTMVNGVPLAGMARLNTDGSVDPLFYPGTGTGGTGDINSVALAPDGSIIVGGTFTTFNGQARDGVAKLVGGELTAPAINATTTTTQVGQAFTYTVPASEQPTSYTATGLPAGLTLSATTGVISGTPTAAGTFVVGLSAANPAGTGNGSLTITVLPATPVISGGDTASQVGIAFTYQVNATNLPASYAAASLPTGLAINPTTGLISGTPTVAGTFVVTLGATNAGGTGTATLTLTVLPVATVTILTAGDAAIDGGEKGKVVFTRTGDTSTALTVRYKVQGSAKAGTDYKALPGTVTIPAGATQIKIKLKTMDDMAVDGTLVAKIKLLPAPDGSYVLGTTTVAKIKITDD